MPEKPDNKGRVWKRAEVFLLPEKLFSNLINSFPTGKEQLSSYPLAVNLTFELILLTCLSLPLSPPLYPLHQTQMGTLSVN